MILGRNLIVALDGVPVAGAKSCQFSISQNFISVCAPTARRVFNKKPTTYDWSMSVDCLIPNSTLTVSLVDKLIAGTRVLLTFTDGSGQNRAGWAYVKSCDESGSVGNLATFSASFEADGELYHYIAYNGAFHQEGNGVQITDTEGTLQFDTTHSVSFTQIYLQDRAEIRIYCSVYWAIYHMTLDDALEAVFQGDTQSLDEAFKKGGFGNTVVTLEPGQGTENFVVLCNDSIPAVLLLY